MNPLMAQALIGREDFHPIEWLGLRRVVHFRSSPAAPSVRRAPIKVYQGQKISTPMTRIQPERVAGKFGSTSTAIITAKDANMPRITGPGDPFRPKTARAKPPTSAPLVR